jgi:hypothetical protein
VFGCTRSLVCKCRKHTSVVTADEAEAPTFPARWFDRLWRALLGVHDLLVTVALRSSSQSLAPAQGCQDHALLPYAGKPFVRAKDCTRCLASIASRAPRLVTIGRTPLFIEAGRVKENHDFTIFGSEISFAAGLDKCDFLPIYVNCFACRANASRHGLRASCLPTLANSPSTVRLNAQTDRTPSDTPNDTRPPRAFPACRFFPSTKRKRTGFPNSAVQTGGRG